jgi:hypothetical protein
VVKQRRQLNAQMFSRSRRSPFCQCRMDSREEGQLPESASPPDYTHQAAAPLRFEFGIDGLANKSLSLVLLTSEHLWKETIRMPYQTVNPFNGEVVRTFDGHTDQQMEQMLAKAERPSGKSGLRSRFGIGRTSLGRQPR